MKKLFVVLSTLALTSVAHAGFMIEPYLGYETGETKQGSTKDDYTGTTLGARLGYGFAGLALGVDYGMNSGTEEGASSDTDIDTTNLGIFASFEFPIMLRVYATYILDSKAEAEGASEDFKGSGMKLGVGWTGLPFVVINLEMSNVTYDEYGSTTLSPEMDVNTYALVVSLPLP